MNRQEILDRTKKLLLTVCIIFVVAIILLLGWIYFVNKLSYNKKYKDNYYSLNYDNTWHINKKENNRVIFINKSDSLVDIKVSKLIKKSDFKSLIQEIRYDVEKNNTNYKLINEEKSYISNNKYEGYKLLYEDNDYQSLVVIVKNNKYLGIITYTANNKYFDIALDSVQLMIGSIKLK